MYLTSFSIKDIKCFEDVTIELPSSKEESYAGWNVILGANATGKTTLLQAMAAALVGPSPAMRLVPLTTWIRRGAKNGIIKSRFLRGEKDSAEGTPRKTPYDASFAVTGNEPVKIDGTDYAAPQILLMRSKSYSGLVKGPYAGNKAGWMVCGYGAFRRFTGGAEDELTHEAGRVGRVASLFREAVALKRDLEWLPQLYARSLDVHTSDATQAKEDFDVVKELLNHLLPAPVQIIEVDTRHVYFTAPGASRVTLPELSDGFRSFLALVIDLLRQIAEVFGGIAALVKRGADGLLAVYIDGVVLIDEIDLHLHPTWQREIGPMLRKVFPQLQFIVSSHSPFIAQAATQDGLFVLHAGAKDESVKVIQPAPLVAGWTAEQILLSPLFGLTGTRDPQTERLLEEHRKLRGMAKFEKLSAEDRRRLVAVEQALSERLTGPGELRKGEVDDLVKVAAEKLRRMRDAEAGTAQRE